MYTTDTPVQNALAQQAEDMQQRIDQLERKARKAQTTTEKLELDSRAQVLRKRRRVVMQQYFEIEDAK